MTSQRCAGNTLVVYICCWDILLSISHCKLSLSSPCSIAFMNENNSILLGIFQLACFSPHGTCHCMLSNEIWKYSMQICLHKTQNVQNWSIWPTIWLCAIENRNSRVADSVMPVFDHVLFIQNSFYWMIQKVRANYMVVFTQPSCAQTGNLH